MNDIKYQKRGLPENHQRLAYDNGGIHQYDGYVGSPIFVPLPPGETVFYDSMIDNQCQVPSKSLEEIKEELGLKLQKSISKRK